MAKNILLSAVALMMILCCVQHAGAQQLPTAGTKTFEITMSPMANVPVTFNEVRFRSFRSHDSALRLRTSLYYESDRFDENTRDTWFQMEIAPGKEWHFLQNERISAYYGAEIPIQYATSRQHREDAAGNTWTNKNNQGGEFFGIGLSAVAGLDVHFLDFLYGGVEVYYMLVFRSGLDGEVNNVTFDNDGRELVFGTAQLGRFRFGIKF
ncbi:hypothetical protein QLX67_08050 [Balneolaceae bacterium ANBcel3]|nr:hypothetical protein [Balneolaceae bacterium ANBcel3]